MLLGRVVGRVWATVKSPGLEGHPLLVVQPVTPELAATGKHCLWNTSGFHHFNCLVEGIRNTS